MMTFDMTFLCTGAVGESFVAIVLIALVAILLVVFWLLWSLSLSSSRELSRVML